MKQLLTKTANAAKRVTSFALALTFVVALAASVSPKVSAATTSMTAAPRVTFTFDDGLESAYTLAAPILAQHGISATNYIITNCIEKKAADHCVAADDNANYMTWAQVAELKAAGWNIGSHTASHPLLSTLTVEKIREEMTTSKQALATKLGGYEALDFAAPYGDYSTAVLAEAAKQYATFRGFADLGPNVWPYDDRLVRNEQVQEGTTVATDATRATFASVKAQIDTAITSKQWLTLTFHDIVTTMPANTNTYATTTTLLDQIAAYVKTKVDAKEISVVSPHDAIVNNTPNMLGDGSFDGALSTTARLASGWSTDETTNSMVKKDNLTNGSYIIGNAASATNSIYMVANTDATRNNHLFSPRVAVDANQTYVVKGYVHVTEIVSNEIAFFVDEYDANGVWISPAIYHSGVSASTDVNSRAKNVNFAYKPSSANVAFAQVYVTVPGASGIKAYIDNIEMFSPTTVVTPPADTTAPVIADIAALPASTGATITWTTSESATSKVIYGVGTSVMGTVVDSAAMTTSHSVALTGLLPNTTYAYQVISADAAGNTTTSAEMTFVTTVAGTAKAGDLNNDGLVDEIDFSTLLFNWNKTGATTAQGDVNGDGIVDEIDMSTLLFNWSNK